MKQEDVEKLCKVAERWHIGASELLERYEKNNSTQNFSIRGLNKIAEEIVQGYKTRLKELLEKEKKRPINREEYIERVTLVSNYL